MAIRQRYGETAGVMLMSRSELSQHAIREQAAQSRSEGLCHVRLAVVQYNMDLPHLDMRGTNTLATADVLQLTQRSLIRSAWKWTCTSSLRRCNTAGASQSVPLHNLSLQVTQLH